MRMVRLAGAGLVVLVAAGLTACSSGINASPQPASAITVTDLPATVDAAVGQTITVVLDSNATTGYAWKVTPAPGAATGVVQIGAQPSYSPPAERIPGRGGKAVTQLQAVGAGTTEIVFTYERSFAPQDHPITEVLTVNVS